jgi:hypothetical protein
MAQEHVDGVIVGDQPENITYGQLIVDLVRAARLPTIFPYRQYFEIGALIAYGPSVLDLWRRLAGYIDQILKGTPPRRFADLLSVEVRLGDQSQDSQSHWNYHPTLVTRARRRGDRVDWRRIADFCRA